MKDISKTIPIYSKEDVEGFIKVAIIAKGLIESKSRDIKALVECYPKLKCIGIDSAFELAMEIEKRIKEFPTPKKVAFLIESIEKEFGEEIEKDSICLKEIYLEDYTWSIAEDLDWEANIEEQSVFIPVKPHEKMRGFGFQENLVQLDSGLVIQRRMFDMLPCSGEDWLKEEVFKVIQ